MTIHPSVVCNAVLGKGPQHILIPPCYLCVFMTCTIDLILKFYCIFLNQICLIVEAFHHVITKKIVSPILSKVPGGKAKHTRQMLMCAQTSR